MCVSEKTTTKNIVILTNFCGNQTLKTHFGGFIVLLNERNFAVLKYCALRG